jgi:RNA polymerase sigma-70 factor (ECF subfamily)
VAVDPAVAQAIADAHRTEWAFVLAATVRVAADLDLAEECVQAAFAKALVAWGPGGIPARPGAWLTTTARNVARDQLRRETVLRRHLPLLVEDETAPPFVWGRAPEIEDDRLRLIFTCCHPSLAVATQVALTLRFVCGLTTAEVARAFLVSESTMAARLTRAKKKITQARIPYRTPTLDELADRVTAVLQVVHLVFTTGHASPGGEELVRDDLVEQGLLLSRMLFDLLPSDAGVTGLLALLVLTDARRATRLVDGRLVLLADQDRSAWDRDAIAEGTRLAKTALEGSRPSIYALMAAIASIHDNSPSWEATDFTAIIGHYDTLMRAWPSPVVALNRAVAIGFAQGPAAGLGALEPLAAEPLLASYPYFPAARADFSRQVGDVRAARLFYEEALMLTANEVERAHLERQLALLKA